MNKYQKAYQRLTNRIYKNDNIEEVYKDLEILGELVDRATPKRPIGKHTDYRCPVCSTRVRSGKGSSSRTKDTVCRKCFQVLDWSKEENCDEE